MKMNLPFPKEGWHPKICSTLKFLSLKVLIILIFNFLITPQVEATAEKFMLWESFDDLTPPAMPSGWIVENSNGDDKTWETIKFGGLPGSRQCIRYVANQSLPANDWIFNSGVTLNSGIQYTLSFRFKVSSASNPEKINVWFGNAPASGSMSTQLFDNNNIIDTTMQLNTVSFTVPTTGTYYIGFHCYSNSNQKRLFVDDILVSCPFSDLKLSFTLTNQILNRGTSTPIYSSNDIIEGNVILENIGSSNLILNKSFNVGDSYEYGTGLTYIVTDPDGKTLIFALKTEPEPWSTEKSFKQVNPGEFAGRIEDLQKLFTFSKSGTYTVQVFYRNYHNSGSKNAWLGRIISEPVPFIIQ